MDNPWDGHITGITVTKAKSLKCYGYFGTAKVDSTVVDVLLLKRVGVLRVLICCPEVTRLEATDQTLDEVGKW